MAIEFLRKIFEGNSGKDALIWRGRAYSFGWLLEAVDRWNGWLREKGVKPGSVAALEGDFSPNGVALLLSLIEQKCIVVPMTESVNEKKSAFRQLAAVEVSLQINEKDEVSILSQPAPKAKCPELIQKLKDSKRPGLILFTSGSAGESKGVVHDFTLLLEKFRTPRHSYRTIAFLLFDHIGGLDTLFYNLSNASTLVIAQDHSPAAICEAVDKYKVQVLPVSPSFLNLLLLSKAYQGHDLSSLEVVTYGAEVMPETTLKKFHELFPKVRMHQKYGLTETGALRSQSKFSDSTWLKIGGEGFETRIRDGMLEIKAQSAMLGYLNAPSPFTEDGWFKTGDAVISEGEFIRILGRKSEIINVGGEKVYPSEVESVLQAMEGVEEVTVAGEANPIMGHIVTMRVKISTGESLADFRNRMRLFCKGKLEDYKIPQKVVFADQTLQGNRLKKIRGKNFPKVSIGIPTYNRSKELSKAIQSVLDQDFKDYELIVSDNCSTDDTPEVMKSFRDSRIQYVRNKENLGMARNFNQCLEMFRGEYCAFLGSDDYWLPGFLEKTVKALDENPRAGIAFTNHDFLVGEKIIPRKSLVKPGMHEECAGMILENNPICLGSALLRMDLIRQIGHFQLGIFNGDFDLYLRAAQSGFSMYYIDERLAVYRLHEENESNDWVKSGESMIKILSDIHFSSARNEKLRRKKLGLFYRQMGAVLLRRQSSESLQAARDQFKKSIDAWPFSFWNWTGYGMTFLPKIFR